ncbi:MAG: hypothetical protein IJH07_03605 [Ruminococcus sp.]|nr:hypothetical protein [Ruminococcus sp.]
MKTFTRVFAVIMIAAILATLMAACGKQGEQKNYIDNNLVGTWTQTDETDGNWTWTFNDDGTCKLVGDDGFESDGTYQIPEEDVGKIEITLEKWEKSTLFTYTATTKVLDLESFDLSYYCQKQ